MVTRPPKYTLPPRPAGLVRRQRLLDYLHKNIDRKIFLVAAAAGYGKTSLVLDFCHDTDFPVAWCALAEDDADLAVFVGDLIGAVRIQIPGFGEALAATLREAGGPSQAEQLATLFAREVEAHAEGYIVLALDDFHLVDQSESVQRFFSHLLARLPEQAHFLITSRTIPHWPMAQLAARQEIAGLSEENLRFTAAEVQELFSIRNGQSVAEAEAEKLTTETEGWITGILLTSHLMWQGLVSTWIRAREADAPVYDYLAEEVLRGLSEDMRRFLLESAVLPDMEIEACNYVLGRADSGEKLRQIEAARLFITGVGDEQRAFRYHHLFREFLLARLRASDPRRLRELQCRAGEWYEAEELPEAALTFYLAAEETDRAVEIAERSAERLFVSGRHETIRQWCEQLNEVSRSVPTLFLYLSKVHTDSGNLSAASDALSTAMEGYQQAGELRGLTAVDVQRFMLAYRQGNYVEALSTARSVRPRADELGLQVHVAHSDRYAGLCQLALGKLDQAQELLQQAADLYKSQRSAYDQAWALHDLARVLRAAGQTARAALAQQEALSIWRERGNLGPLAMALNNIGWDQHMLGQYESALATYAEALEYARQAGATPAEILILAGQGDLLAELGDLRAANDLYRRAITLALSSNEVGLLSYLYRTVARLERWSGNHVVALEWLCRAELTAASSQADTTMNPQALRGIIMLEMGNQQGALEILRQTCAQLESAGDRVDLTQPLLFLAMAQFRCGMRAEAFTTLQQSLTLAEAIGYDQPLIAEVPHAKDLFEAAAALPGLGPGAANLLARAEAMRNYAVRATRQPSQADKSPSATINVRVLGQTRVIREGNELGASEWASLQARELFLYIVANAPVRREALLEIFWPNLPTARATANFHQRLYMVRRAIGKDAIVFEDGKYAIAPNVGLDYDAARFETAGRSALARPAGDLERMPALAIAASLYTGEFLADLPAEWAAERRRGLSNLYVELLREYAEELMRLARYVEARDVIARASTVEPLRDDLHALMLKVLSAMGRRHEVVEHYQRYRETLRAEIGLDPPAEIRALYSRLIS